MGKGSLRRYGVISMGLLLTACAGQQGRYSMLSDEAPSSAPDLEQLEIPKPRYEPKSRGGNKDYQVWGKQYQVLKSSAGYQEEGIASWYGAKFHGHLTSNGETYDMYAFSAAHKSLPLPSYARVTNLTNDREIVVRVNDRGPFHQGRIIDLSYAAAWKLGVLETGTARVRVEAYHFADADQPALLPAELAALAAEQKQAKIRAAEAKAKAEQEAKLAANGRYIQLVASQDPAALDRIGHELNLPAGIVHRVVAAGTLHKLQVGPVAATKLPELLAQLRQDGYPGAFALPKQ